MQKLDKKKLTFLGNRYKLVPYLDRAIATFDEPWTFAYQEKEKDFGWHPSSHCIPQTPELYAYAKGVLDGIESDTKIPTSTRKSFMVGHFWHQWIQHLIVKLELADKEDIERKEFRGWNNPGVEPELMKPFHYTSGSADVCPLVLPKWEGVLDIKTMSLKQFKQPELPDHIALKYECQLNIYMDIFHQEKAMILAVAKDSPHEFKEFEFMRNQPLIDEIYRKWEYVSAVLDGIAGEEFLDVGELPGMGPCAS